MDGDARTRYGGRVPLCKDSLYNVLLKSAIEAGFRVTGEPYFRRRSNEPAFPRIAGTWPCGMVKKGEPDCIWMKADGTPVAAFEIEGYDVKDDYTGGIMKDGIYLSASPLAGAVRAIILFGLKEDGKSYKNGIEFPAPLDQIQRWSKKRAQSLAALYGVPSEIPIVLDDEVVGGLLPQWIAEAQRL